MITNDIRQGVNSYCTFEFADDYISTNVFIGDAWAGLSTQTRVNYLITAQHRLEQLTWKGEKLNNEQPLSFPRVFTYENTGYDQYDGITPPQMKKAQCELVINWIDTSGNRELQKLIDMGIKNIEIDVLTFSDIVLKEEGLLPKSVVDLIGIFTDENLTGKNTIGIWYRN